MEFRQPVSDPCYLRPVIHVDSSGQVYLHIMCVGVCVCVPMDKVSQDVIRAEPVVHL